jgi:hypothetical protein
MADVWGACVQRLGCGALLTVLRSGSQGGEVSKTVMKKRSFSSFAAVGGAGGGEGSQRSQTQRSNDAALKEGMWPLMQGGMSSVEAMSSIMKSQREERESGDDAMAGAPVGRVGDSSPSPSDGAESDRSLEGARRTRSPSFNVTSGIRRAR